MYCDECGKEIKQDEDYSLHFHYEIKRNGNGSYPPNQVTFQGMKFCRVKCALRFMMNSITLCKGNSDEG